MQGETIKKCLYCNLIKHNESSSLKEPIHSSSKVKFESVKGGL